MDIIKFNKSHPAHTLLLNADRPWFINIEDRRFACTPDHGDRGEYELEITTVHADTPYESILEIRKGSGTYSLARLMYIPITPLPPNQPH